MKKDTQLSAVGEEIMGALNGFLTALEEGGDLAKRFTVRTVELDLKPRVYTGGDVKKTRESLELSQALFARFLGVSVKTIHSWEQGIKTPSSMARRFLDEITCSPEHWRDRLRASIVERGQKGKPTKGRQPCES